MATVTTKPLLEIQNSGSGEIAVKLVSGERIQESAEGSGRYNFNWSVGNLTVKGNVDTRSFAIASDILGLGIDLGPFEGDLKDGMKITFDMGKAKGMVHFYLKNGAEVWVHADFIDLSEARNEAQYKLVNMY